MGGLLGSAALVVMLSLYISGRGPGRLAQAQLGGTQPQAVGKGDEATTLGRQVYEKYCIGCHGAQGDGKGAAASFLNPKPRDFTGGVFKFRATPPGSLPSDDDLIQSITGGIRFSSMPSFTLVSRGEREAVVTYVKSFSPRFKVEKPGPRVFIPDPPAYLATEESGSRGRLLFQTNCVSCHGPGGQGDGPAAANLVDGWGQPTLPLNLTRRNIKSGASPRDIYRSITTGLNGTPMPAFGATLTDDQRWDVVSYILSLKQAARKAEG